MLVSGETSRDPIPNIFFLSSEGRKYWRRNGRSNFSPQLFGFGVDEGDLLLGRRLFGDFLGTQELHLGLLR